MISICLILDLLDEISESGSDAFAEEKGHIGYQKGNVEQRSHYWGLIFDSP